MAASFRDLERAEFEGWTEIISNTSREFRERFDAAVHIIHGAVAVVAPKTDMLAMNRVWLAGASEKIRGEILDEIIELFHAKGSPKILLHCPRWTVTDDGIEAITSRGFKSVGPMTKLVRSSERSVEQDKAFTIREVRESESGLFGEIAAQGNDAPETMNPGFNSTVGVKGWHHYLAYDGPNPVAAAALRTIGDVAWCCFAGTLPEFRRRGAQSALLARRIRDAAKSGCGWVACETISETPERPVQSLRNMKRAGFAVAYERLTFVSS